MPREIRITIDDDEVFERMKARKQVLDLSWEDVLHRGLRGTDADEPGGPGRHQWGRTARARPDPVTDPAGFAENLKRQIQGQVRESFQDSLAPGPDPLGADVATLESAEDAVLVFDFLGEMADDRAFQVPLRVTLEAGGDGLAVDVVSIREGKTVTDMNAFDPAVRKQIIEGLAGGDFATLSLDGGAESYRVTPTLSWSRTDGVPSVSAVDIEEVRFDAA